MIYNGFLKRISDSVKVGSAFHPPFDPLLLAYWPRAEARELAGRLRQSHFRRLAGGWEHLASVTDFTRGISLLGKAT